MGQILHFPRPAESDPYEDRKTFKFDLNDGLNFGVLAGKDRQVKWSKFGEGIGVTPIHHGGLVLPPPIHFPYDLLFCCSSQTGIT